MGRLFISRVLFVLSLNIISGYHANGMPYDHTFTSECLSNPLKPQYGGGLLMNAEFDDGLKGWKTSGAAELHLSESKDGGNNYIIASRRSQPFDSFAQDVYLEKEKLYTVSAWVQVNNGSSDVAAVIRIGSRDIKTGWVAAQAGCWSMLKGGLVVNESGPAQLYLLSYNTQVDIWGDSISLQGFTKQEWEAHRLENIEKVRKSTVKFVATDEDGRPVPNATVSIKQLRIGFPLGCAINKNILTNTAYQHWFFSRFKYTVFENEMKWYATERSPGNEDFSVADAMLRLVKSHGVSVRGHNVFWDDPTYQVSWTRGLSSNDLSAAVNKRINSVVSRYKGHLIHWDVVNENMHWNYYETALGSNFSVVHYKKTNELDGNATPFLNEFNTLEEIRDSRATPSKYLQKIRELRQQGYNGPLGIGLEGHFTTANLPYIRSGLDILATAGLPIWITELDVASGPNQVPYFEQILRETHAHPAVEGVMLWSAWKEKGCYQMCLTDNNFNNLASGEVVDSIRREWTLKDDITGETDTDGVFQASMFHGEYKVKIRYPNGKPLSRSKKIKIRPNAGDEDVYHFKAGQ